MLLYQEIANIVIFEAPKNFLKIHSTSQAWRDFLNPRIHQSRPVYLNVHGLFACKLNYFFQLQQVALSLSTLEFNDVEWYH